MSMLFITSLLLGVGLAMDAFSVSLADGLNEPKMKKRKVFCIATIFAVFQAIMPLIGWICVHTIVTKFAVFEKFIPFIALALLSYIGGKMLWEGIKCKKDKCDVCRKQLRLSELIVQGIATSIDALSVGFVISDYNLAKTLICVAIIAIVTFAICSAGVFIGKKFGDYIAGKASVLGGLILIFIGIEIFITGIL